MFLARAFFDLPGRIAGELSFLDAVLQQARSGNMGAGCNLRPHSISLLDMRNLNIGYIATGILLLLGILAACGGPSVSPMPTTEPVQPTTEREVCSRSSTLSGRSVHGDIQYITFEPTAWRILPPSDIQEFVNRVDTIVVGSITAVDDTTRITGYELQIDEILLDDGKIAANPRISQWGEHSPCSPQAGERFLFALQAQDEGRGYSVFSDWDLILLDGNPVQTFDGHPLPYASTTDVETLFAAIKSAVPTRVRLPVPQFPDKNK